MSEQNYRTTIFYTFKTLYAAESKNYWNQELLSLVTCFLLLYCWYIAGVRDHPLRANKFMMVSSFLQKRLDMELESATSEEPSDYLLVASFTGFWTVRALPVEVKSPELVEEYAKSLVLEEEISVILVRSGREFVHFHHDGSRVRILMRS